jgi:hypothetical protein
MTTVDFSMSLTAIATGATGYYRTVPRRRGISSADQDNSGAGAHRKQKKERTHGLGH